MANLTVRNVPDDVHRALRAQAKAHGRSAEAEVRQILGDALIPSNRLHLGDALAALGRQLDLSDEDVDALESAHDLTPQSSPG
ncbi:Arc family DNA-binding protein [Corynebacterium glyciniphilum]|uniref:FitA-like ribbon-helix-helix domain-containing protein n=1 Tax=Corynebacterium glyciniphilum TaxID=1404244 RepID=UPI00264D9567|nr:Arc family DNA-binding protein [Corynebacterium glyciniphilum]MDN6707004.1 Arc family DNA-binding protein [Corynebacterium glyciniphilum]